MTNRLALVLGLLAIGALILDHLAFGGEGTLFMLQRGIAFLKWLAFWR